MYMNQYFLSDTVVCSLSISSSPYMHSFKTAFPLFKVLPGVKELSTLSADEFTLEHVSNNAEKEKGGMGRSIAYIWGDGKAHC